MSFFEKWFLKCFFFLKTSKRFLKIIIFRKRFENHFKTNGFKNLYSQKTFTKKRFQRNVSKKRFPIIFWKAFKSVFKNVFQTIFPKNVSKNVFKQIQNIFKLKQSFRKTFSKKNYQKTFSNNVFKKRVKSFQQKKRFPQGLKGASLVTHFFLRRS